jgi:hypothetical protein
VQLMAATEMTSDSGPEPADPAADQSEAAPYLGPLVCLAPWSSVVGRLDRRWSVPMLLIAWWLGSEMVAQLEDELLVMHLPGDRAFSVASLDRAGGGLAAVLDTWRQWQLSEAQAGFETPSGVINVQLVIQLLLPSVTLALLAIAARRALVPGRSATTQVEIPRFLRQIAAIGVVLAPLGIALAHARNALVAVATAGGITPLGAVHGSIALSIPAASAAMAMGWWLDGRPGRPGASPPGLRRRPFPFIVAASSAVGLLVLVGAGVAATVMVPPACAPGRGPCRIEPPSWVGTSLSLISTAGGLVTAVVVLSAALATVPRARAWIAGGGPGRAVRAVLAVRGQVLAVIPVVMLPLLGTSDLGLQVQNGLSRLLESPPRVAGLLAGVLALMALVAALAQRSVTSAAERPTIGYGKAPGWMVGALAVLALAAGGVLYADDVLPGLQALLLLVGAVLLLSVPADVRRYAAYRTVAHEPMAGVDIGAAAAAALVTAAIPLALASLCARLAVTATIGPAQPIAAGLLVLFAGCTLAAYLHSPVAIGSARPSPVARLVTGRSGTVLLGSLTAVAAGLGVWGAVDPIGFGLVLGSMLTLLAVAAVLAVVAGGLVLAGNRLPAWGALAVLGFRRVPFVLGVLAVVVLASQIDPAPVHHDVRTIEAAGTGDSRSVTLQAAFDRWADAADKPAPGNADAPTPVPLVFVATAGGGIKAAYWTTLVLGCLQGEDPDRERCLAGGSVPRSNLFLASGISGGSLGLALDHARHAGGSPPHDALVDVGLATDFLAPDLAALVLRDGPNAVLHAGTWDDRAAVLEDAWARGFTAAGADDPGLGGGFFGGAAGPDGSLRFPMLLLNSAGVEDRCRLAVTAVDLAPASVIGRSCVSDPLASGTAADATVSRTKEITNYLCPDRDLRLSSAALLSARFPFVSPYGQLRRCIEGAGEAPPESFAVDGGLVESSAAGPVPEVLSALEPIIERWEGEEANRGLCIAPRLVMIDHGYTLDTLVGAPAVPGQLRAPSAFLAADSAISAAAQQEAVNAFARYQRDHPCGRPDDPSTVSFALALHPGQRAPLGWTLSQAARDEMRNQLTSHANRCRLVAVRQWFTPLDRPASPDAAGCVTGRLIAQGTLGPADLRGAQLVLERVASGPPMQWEASTDGTGRFELAVATAPPHRYTLCLHRGEGAGTITPLGERVDGGGTGRPDLPPFTIQPDRVTRLDDVPEC